jgi:hypothetical protein
MAWRQLVRGDTLHVPEAAIDPFVTQLAHLCATQRTRVKWVFVPTHALGRTLGERIALAGTDWLNLRFVTSLDMALRMGAPFWSTGTSTPPRRGSARRRSTSRRYRCRSRGPSSSGGV